MDNSIKVFHNVNSEKIRPNTKKSSATGNRTPVSRVTGGDTSHYTIAELVGEMFANYIDTI